MATTSVFGSLSDTYLGVLHVLVSTVYLWGPPVLLYLIWVVYVHYIRARWLKNLSTVLLEIKIPKNVSKSPKAMEVIMMAMYQTSTGSLIDKYIGGRLRSSFSLEIASLGGQIHFFIHCENKYRNYLESHIYAQYPEAEIVEADDYTKYVPFGMPGSDWDFWGAEYLLDKPDAYPIKTYIDYGLDTDPKEEFKVDPLASLVEGIAAIGPREQFWYQISIRATYKDWKEEAAALVDKLMKRDKVKDDAAAFNFSQLLLSPGERSVVEAIERSQTKYGFDASVRIMYLAKKEYFVGVNIVRILSFMRQFGTNHLNGFKMKRWTSFDYPWEDFMGLRLKKRKKEMFESFRRRVFFYSPFSLPSSVLNT